MSPLSNRRPHEASRADLLRQMVERSEIDQVVVLANAEPFSHDTTADGRVTVRHSRSGLVRAVEPLILATSGVWIAHGAGSADRLTTEIDDGLGVPPLAPSYRLRRVWLSDGEIDRYYDGFANGALWPLCHRAHVPPVFRAEDFNAYWEINSRFADRLGDEVRGHAPLVLVQDYHLALAPMMIRVALPDATIVACWHIPWPSWQTFETCPWHKQLLEGLLGADIVGFQTAADCRSFLETAQRLLKQSVVRTDDVLVHSGHRTEVRAYPTSITWPSPWALEAPPVSACREQVRHALNLPAQARLSVSVSRLDYTKGIEEAFCAIGHLLDEHPMYRGVLTHIQLAALSRTGVPAYREFRRRVHDTADRINRRFGRGDYRPIVLITEPWDSPAIFRLFRAADVCYVGSLHDGMNLVAKEFVAARDDEQGVLMLSAFAGAAWQLHDALVVNPYDRDEVALTLARALEMAAGQQEARMHRLRQIVAEESAAEWGGRILTDVSRLTRRRRTAPRTL